MKLIRYEYPQNPGTGAFNRFFELGAPAFERFNSLFDDFFGAETAGARPAADLYEDEQNYYARLELPGVKKDTIDIELENSVLTIASRQTESSETGEARVSFQRSISVPDGVKLEKVSARHEDGVLTVTMPKQEARKPRQIAVK